MKPQNNPDDSSKIWDIMDKLLNGELAMLQIRQNLESVVSGLDFIAKYLEPCGNSIRRIPCNDCDEVCDNKKWIKQLSSGSIVKVCPSHPDRCEDLLVEDIMLFRIGATFFQSVSMAMKLHDIPESFADNELVHIGNWNTANYFAPVYVSRIKIPKFFEAAITKLLSENPDRDKNEKIAVIVPCMDVPSAEVHDLLRKDRSKCFCFDELFDISAAGEILFKAVAVNYFSSVDMTKLINQHCAFIERKDIKGDIQWYVQGHVTAFKRTKRSVHFKILNLLMEQHNAGGDWVSHEIIRIAVAWAPEKYWGNGNDNSGQAQKVISDLRRELGINIDYDRDQGFKITGTVKS